MNNRTYSYQINLKDTIIRYRLIRCKTFVLERMFAMLSNIGIPGLILILVLALIIFGPKKLPEIGRAFGETLQEFKKSTREITSDVVEESNEEKKTTN